MIVPSSRGLGSQALHRCEVCGLVCIAQSPPFPPRYGIFAIGGECEVDGLGRPNPLCPDSTEEAGCDAGDAQKKNFEFEVTGSRALLRLIPGGMF